MASANASNDEAPSAASLLRRCDVLLKAIASLEAYASAGKSGRVDVKNFKGAVQSEERSLQRLSTADPEAEKTIHNLRSSNLPFHEALWAAALSCQNLIGLQKKFSWEQPRVRSSAKPKRRREVVVDVVAQNGLQWIKVSTITETKLLFEKAKAGWEADEWNSDSDDGGRVKKIYPDGVVPPPDSSDGEDSGEEFGRIELVRVAQDLQRAAGATRFQFKHPRVLVVLPNITAGSSAIVDGVLDEIKAAGAVVHCGPLPRQVPDSFESMIPPSIPHTTSTLNLDCTILLALISDLSHSQPDELFLPDNPHPSLVHQLQVEKSSPLLPEVLYPGLGSAERLVTSKRAATRMWEIVHAIGTPTERARAVLLLSDAPDGVGASGRADADAAALCARFRDLSVHQPPPLALPIHVLDGAILSKSDTAPGSVLAAVATELSDINRSVFMLGWTNRWTTVTSNKVAVKVINAVLTKELDGLERLGAGCADVEGPNIWTIDVARSLVGKEGGRAL